MMDVVHVVVLMMSHVNLLPHIDIHSMLGFFYFYLWYRYIHLKLKLINNNVSCYAGYGKGSYSITLKITVPRVSYQNCEAIFQYRGIQHVNLAQLHKQQTESCSTCDTSEQCQKLYHITLLFDDFKRPLVNCSLCQRHLTLFY